MHFQAAISTLDRTARRKGRGGGPMGRLPDHKASVRSVAPRHHHVHRLGWDAKGDDELALGKQHHGEPVLR
jgi:hypothetical protein